MATMVLVHGGWSSGRAWDAVVPLLAEHGHASAVIQRLPSSADAAADVGDLDDDIRTVRAALDRVGDDAVLVAHSLGGLVTTEVADHPAIVRTVYVAAFWPPRGTSLLDLAGPEPGSDWFAPTEDGVLALGELDAVHRAVAADVDRAAFRTHYEHLGLQSMASYATPMSAPERSHPVTYVVCLQDHALPPQAQEQMALRADDVVRLDSAHCPMLSMPGRLADVLDAAAP